MANQKNKRKTTKKPATSNPKSQSPTTTSSKASNTPNLRPNPKPSWRLKNAGVLVESEAGTNPDTDIELVQKATETILGPHELTTETTEWTPDPNDAGSSDDSVSEPRDDEDDESSESTEDGKISSKLSCTLLIYKPSSCQGRFFDPD
jgi:hypothetical protein